jgi:hypothetical protein
MPLGATSGVRPKATSRRAMAASRSQLAGRIRPAAPSEACPLGPHVGVRPKDTAEGAR